MSMKGVMTDTIIAKNQLAPIAKLEAASEQVSDIIMKLMGALPVSKPIENIIIDAIVN